MNWSRYIAGVYGIGTLSPDTPQVKPQQTSPQQPQAQQRSSSHPPKPNTQLPPKPSYMSPLHVNSSDHKKPPMPSPPSQRKSESEVLYYMESNHSQHSLSSICILIYVEDTVHLIGMRFFASARTHTPIT